VQQATFETADLVETLDQQQLFDHYTVQPGDTLTHIAAAYGIPWEALYALNTDQVAHPDSIWPGLQLRLPA
jgi:LysM repeat protein